RGGEVTQAVGAVFVAEPGPESEEAGGRRSVGCGVGFGGQAQARRGRGVTRNIVTRYNTGMKVSQAEFEALADFRQAVREFLRFSETAAAAAGLTPRQHQALLALRGTRGTALLSIGDLAGRLYVRHHSAVGLVDRLAALGLVARRPGKP